MAPFGQDVNRPPDSEEVKELNVLKPNKQTTIQTLLALGKSQREIARVTGIDRKTIRGYQRQAERANSPGVATGSPEQTPPPLPAAHTSACEPWRQFIEQQLALKRNATAIYQDLVDLHGFCLLQPEPPDRAAVDAGTRDRSELPGTVPAVVLPRGPRRPTAHVGPGG